ncbi:MAG: hypothetical protein ACXVCY_09930 [Pseudobdellovibrionaceae bacterium]
MKTLFLLVLTLGFSINALAEWDGTGFYGTKEEAKETLIVLADNNMYVLKTYEQDLPRKYSRSIDLCTIKNTSVEMAEASIAAMTATTGAVAIEKNGEPVKFYLFPKQKINGKDVIYTVNTEDCTVAKLNELKPNTSVKKARNSLNDLEKAGVRHSVTMQAGSHAIGFSVNGEENIHLSNANYCDAFVKKDGTPYKNVMGFRTGICKQFREFGYKEGANYDSCIQIVRAANAQEAQDYWTTSAIFGTSLESLKTMKLFSSAIYSSTQLKKILDDGKCF